VINGGVPEWGDLGEKEMNKTFSPRKGREYDPKRLSNIVDFLASKMKMGDTGEIQEILEKLHGEQESSDVLFEVLMGIHDKELEENEVGSRTDIYTVALYLYANTDHSEEKMVDVLGSLVTTFDDPKKSRYDVDCEGLLATPNLASICRKAIEKEGIHDAVRGKVIEELKSMPKLDRTHYERIITKKNAWRAGIDLDV